MNPTRARLARATVLAQLVTVGAGSGSPRVVLAVTGSLTIAFAFALRAHLGNAALVLALSSPGLGVLSDTFLVVAVPATLAAPFVLAAAMRRQERWSALARPTRTFGFVTIGLLAVMGATSTLAAVGVAVLAVHVVRVDGRSWHRLALMVGR